MSVTVGFLALLEAKPGKADELAAFLTQARELALAEPLTVNWYAFRVDKVTYGVYDTFEAEAGREAHQAGEISKALMAAAPELLAKDPNGGPDRRQVTGRGRGALRRAPDGANAAHRRRRHIRLLSHALSAEAGSRPGHLPVRRGRFAFHRAFAWTGGGHRRKRA